MRNICKTITKGVSHHYLVETYREDGRVRQRILAYLGEHNSVKAALEYWQGQEKVANDAENKDYVREMVVKLAQLL